MRAISALALALDDEGLRLPELLIEFGRLDLGQQVARFHLAPMSTVHFLDVAVDPRIDR